MRLILDFDDVLFNTTAFYKKIQGLFFDADVKPSELKKSYARIFHNPSNYTFTAHIQILNKDFGYALSQQKLQKKLDDVVKTCSSLLYDDTIEFLEFFKKSHIPMDLASTGVKDWQLAKFHGSGMTPYFENVEILPPEKLTKNDAVEKLIRKRGDCVFMDDKAEIIGPAMELKVRFPKLYVIRVRRGRHTKKENTIKPDGEVRDLGEAKALIVKQFLS